MGQFFRRRRVWRRVTSVALAAVLIAGCTPNELGRVFDRAGNPRPPWAQLVELARLITRIEEYQAHAKTFRSSISPVSRSRLGVSWNSRCPVAPSDLRLVRVSYWGLDSRAHTGEVIVNRAIAQATVAGFRSLYAGKFPIEQMLTVDRYMSASAVAPDGSTTDGPLLDANTPPPLGPQGAITDVRNNTYAYVCRKVTGGSTWSRHAYGMAIDINPFYNPYVSRSQVIPSGGYASRDSKPGKFVGGSWAVASFTDQGFTWGGNYRSIKDYMHFEKR